MEPAINDLPAIMNQGLRLLRSLGAAARVQEETLAGLVGRLAEGRFHLAVLGQFKRGKSTFLNAQLGEDILPSSVIPLTAIPTFIRHGEQRSIRVHFQDQRQEEMAADTASAMNAVLLRYVSEEMNRKNEKGVSFVEITHPARLLREVVLIDTPGVGSTHLHNTEATLNFLPQCDAALFLVSADPPITEVEVEFLRRVREKVARVFFVLNKIDNLSEGEREIALAFLRSVLAERIGTPPDQPIFAVSAKQALAAKQTGDQTLLAASGLLEVTDNLISFLARDKNRVLQEALGKKAVDILADVSLQLNLEMRSLQMPIVDLEERLALFEQKIEEASRQRQQARDVLNGDRERVVAHLEEECERLRLQARHHLRALAESKLTAGESNPRAVEDAFAEEIPAYFERALGEVTKTFDAEMLATLSGHQKRAGALIESIRVAASTIFQIPHHAAAAPRPVVLARDPYWVSRKQSSGGMLEAFSPELADRFLSKSRRERRIRTRIEKEIESLVIRNVENLRWATLQNIDAAFRVYSKELDTDLAHTLAATHGAIAAAYERRKEHAEEVASRLSRLQQDAAELQALIDRLTHP